MANDNLLQKELYSLTVSLLAKKNNLKTLLAIFPKASSTLVTPFSTEPQGIKFHKSPPNCDPILTAWKTLLPVSM